MKIERDYSQPFFRQPKRHRSRNLLIAAFLGLLLGLAILWQQLDLHGWQALENIAQSLSSAPPTRTPLPSERANQAAALALAGDFLAAEALLAQAAAERPQNIAYLYEHGTVLLELGRPEEAQALGLAISDIDTRDARGFALKAAALTQEGQATLAIPIALAGLEANPRFTPLYATLTRAYVEAQRWAEALESGERGLAIEIDNADLNRAYAYALQSVGAYSDAINYLQRAIELRPSYLPPQFELAFLYLARDENQSAIDLYNRILSLDSTNSRAMLRLCQAYRKVGEFARALGFCEDAVANDSSNTEAQYQLGLLYYRNRRFEEARVAFADCLAQATGGYNLTCRYLLGLAHYYTGDCAGGWTLLREALDLALAGAGNETSLNIILQGLQEIESDRQCIDKAAAPITVQD